MEWALNSPYIVSFDAATAADHARIGGKCTSLAKMTAHGVSVPFGFAVTTEAYAAHMKSPGLAAQVDAVLATIDVDDVMDEESKSARIRALIVEAKMPGDVEAAIRQAYARFGASGDQPVAVRSSATAEDMPDASFAGQQDTYLWVVGADDVVTKVKSCWASLFNTRAISYRAKNHIAGPAVEMAVGVQKMVDAVSAGVAMTLNPINGDRTKIVIDSAFGLGEPVVSGEITPDNFVVEKVLLEIVSRKIVEKDHELVPDRAARCAVDRVIEPERRTLPSLSDAQIIAVARLAKALESFMGCPQDVEWAIDRDLPEGGDVVALQSRPETVWSRKPPPGRRSYSLGVDGVLSTLMAPLQNKK
jgi:pyruvate,water dikinase